MLLFFAEFAVILLMFLIFYFGLDYLVVLWVALMESLVDALRRAIVRPSFWVLLLVLIALLVRR